MPYDAYVVKLPYREVSIPIEDYTKYYQIKPDDVVVDAGAHVGHYTLQFSSAVGPNGRVITIEPDPQVLPILRDIIKPLKNVTLVTLGLWSKTDVLRFGLTYGSGRSAISKIIPDDIVYPLYTEIFVDTLDNIIEMQHLERVNFIKMDIECAELEALRGAVKTIEDFRPNLAIAAYHNGSRYDVEEMVKLVNPFIEDLNYRTKYEKGILYGTPI